LKSLFNSNNQEVRKNPIRPPLWHPPIELSDHEMTMDDSIDAAAFAVFIEKFLCSQLWARAVVVMLGG
jgi:hypothetical protein